MWMLGLVQDPDDTKAARARQSTFTRRYRNNPAFPKPVASPEGRLVWREDEVDAFIESLQHVEGDPRDGTYVMEPGKGRPRNLEAA
jgi:predicted DNA-binding transcriptional regulator AlpA